MIIDIAEILAARILIVDDLPANIALFSQLLAQTGYTNINTTQDPTKVVALHEAHCYDLILLDLVM